MIVSEKYQSWLFFILTLAWSETIWISCVNCGIYWFWLGLAGPGLFAVVLTLLTDGFAGLKKLLKSLLYWKVGFKYYFLIFIAIFIFFFIAAYFTNKSNVINLTIPPIKAIIIIFEVIILSCLCEELGWRGYALPKLICYTNGFYASLILGVMWGLWHIPLAYARNPLINVTLIVFYFIFAVSVTFIFNWLYLKTKSLLAVGIFHGILDVYPVLFFPSVMDKSSGIPNNITIIMFLVLSIFTMPYLWRIKKNSLFYS